MPYCQLRGQLGHSAGACTVTRAGAQQTDLARGHFATADHQAIALANVEKDGQEIHDPILTDDRHATHGMQQGTCTRPCSS